MFWDRPSAVILNEVKDPNSDQNIELSEILRYAQNDKSLRILLLNYRLVFTKRNTGDSASALWVRIYLHNVAGSFLSHLFE